MNAGIAGVARMIERLDFSSKRFGGSAHVSTSTATASGFNSSFKGKRVETNSKSSNNGDKTEPQKLQVSDFSASPGFSSSNICFFKT